MRHRALLRRVLICGTFALLGPSHLVAQAKTEPSAADSLKSLSERQRFLTDTLGLLAREITRLEGRVETAKIDTSVSGRSSLLALQDSVRETNRAYAGLQSRLSDLNSRSAALATDRLKQLETERIRLEAERWRLGKESKSAQRDIEQQKVELEKLQLQKSVDSIAALKREGTVRELAKLKANVASWENLGGVVSTVSLTAQQLLIFPEADTGLTTKVQSFLQWTGVVTALAGSVVAIRGDAPTGTGMVGGGLAVSALIQRALTSNTKVRIVATRVARNVGFGDDVKSLANVTPTFRADAERLRGELELLESTSSTALPSEQQLNTYFKLISQQRAIFAILSTIRARGQFLLESFGDEVGAASKGSLRKLIDEADRATSRWYTYEPVLLQPYQYILREKRGF